MTVLGHARPPTIPMVFTASSELTLAPGTGGHAPGSLPSGTRAQIRSGRAENPQVNAGESAGSTMKGWPGWPTGPDPGGPGWAGAS
jgi:hypothetical protein